MSYCSALRHLFFHIAPATQPSKTHITLFFKLLVAADLRWEGAQWGHWEIPSNWNQSAFLVFLTSDSSPELSSSPFKRKEDFFTWVNLKANPVPVILPSPNIRWAQWLLWSLRSYVQRAMRCFQDDLFPEKNGRQGIGRGKKKADISKQQQKWWSTFQILEKKTPTFELGNH